MKQSRELLTVKEIAEVLKVTKLWVYLRTKRGQKGIPHLRVGGNIRFIAEDVIEFFKSDTQSEDKAN